MKTLIACILCIASVAAAELPADFHRGVNHAHVHRNGRGYGSPVSAAELGALKAIGVTHVALTPFGYQQSFDAPHVQFGGDRSMSTEHIAAEVKAAHAIGIKVTMKPHIWSRDFWRGEQWHGTVDQPTPEAHALWWADYRAMSLHWARFCEDHRVEVFCIGTELVKMTAQYPDEWRTLITDIRAVYNGKVTYAAHWYAELNEITFWDALDFVGVSAYFPLEAPAGATKAELVTAWEPHKVSLARLATRTGKSIAFMEVGYRPVSDAHRKPWEYDGGEPDEGGQARAYGALFEALGGEPWWMGAYVWKTFTDPGRGRRGFAFRGLQGEAVIKRWYGGATE